MAPGDQGLSSLGLLMQLAGSVALAFGACLLTVPDVPLVARVTLAGLTMSRALFHREAGVRLVYRTAPPVGGDHDGFAGVRPYLAIAGLHTLIACGVLVALDVPASGVIAIGAALVVWPATLAIAARRCRVVGALPVHHDNGVEGASAVMTVLAAWALVATLALLATLLDMPRSVLEMAGLVLIVVVMLGVRAVLHLHAGIGGLRETSLAGAVANVQRYASFAIVTAFVTAVALLLLGMMPRLDLQTVLGAGALGWILAAWPLIIRRFITDRQLSDLVTERPYHRAPDAGRAGLGWLLAGHAALTLAFALPALAHCGVAAGAAQIGGRTTRAPAWSIAAAVLEAWAALWLVRGGGRIAATVFGLAGTAIGVYLAMPMLHGLAIELRGPSAFVHAFVAAGAIVVPATTLALVHRTVTPVAIARYR